MSVASACPPPRCQPTEMGRILTQGREQCLLHQTQERLDCLQQVRLGRVFLLAMRQAVRRIREHHHDRHVRHHLGRVVQGSRREPRRVARHLADRFRAQLDQVRIERTRIDPPQRAPLDRDVVVTRGILRRAPGVFEHLREDGGIERSLIERDLADARHRGDDRRFHRHDPHRADDARDGRRMAARDLAALERRLCRSEERVAPHRNRRRPGMRRLADEADHVALDAERAKHDARRLVHRLEHRPLFDVELEIAARGDLLQRGMRLVHAIQIDAVLRDRIRQRRPLPIDQRAYFVRPQAAARGRGSQQAAAEARAFLVRPVDDGERPRRAAPLVHAQRAEACRHAEAAVEPAAIRDRIQVAADDDRVRRVARQRDPVVTGRVGRHPQAERGHVIAEPRARVAPHRPPGQTLRAVGCARAGRQRAQIGDHAFGLAAEICGHEVCGLYGSRAIYSAPMQTFLAEAIGTMILVLLGDGVVANVVLARTKGNNGGWIVITMGWGVGVAIAIYAVGRISGAHLNPAVSIALATMGSFPWAQVPGYIAAQMIGGFAGAVLVWLSYLPHWGATTDPGTKLAVFCTGPAIRNTAANVICEVIGTALLAFGALAIGANAQGWTKPGDVDFSLVFSRGLQPLLVGVLILGIGLSLGGPTGYALNPARDLGPRIAHAVLPIPGKGSSDWEYAWIPVIAPIVGAIAGAGLYTMVGF